MGCLGAGVGPRRDHALGTLAVVGVAIVVTAPRTGPAPGQPCADPAGQQEEHVIGRAPAFYDCLVEVRTAAIAP